MKRFAGPKSIIGLDPSIPSVYEIFSIPPQSSLILPSLFARSGLRRLVPSFFNQSAAIAAGHLTKEDEEIYRSLFYRSTLTVNMIEEMKQVKHNANMVKIDGIPKQIPMLFFISDGEEAAVDNWESMLMDYAAQLNFGETIVLATGHYIHAWEPKQISDEIDAFLSDSHR